LGGTVTAILIAAIFIVWLRQWWKRGEENYQDRAAENEVEYLEELADEHKRGVEDHSERLRYLLKNSKIKNPERYKSRIDNVRRVIGDRWRLRRSVATPSATGSGSFATLAAIRLASPAVAKISEVMVGAAAGDTVREECW
jgi:hypothetical protein